MFSKVGITLLLPALVYFFSCAWGLWRNIRLAKKSGIPYVVVPRFNYNILTGLASRWPMRLLNYVDPESRHPPSSWRRVVKVNWPWNLRYAPFAHLGTDTFLTVSPGGIMLYSADAEVISQITSRYSDFPKPTHIYKSVDIYGKNIVSSEGQAWRHHRKATAIAFSEKTNRLVWEETIQQAGALLDLWKKATVIPSLAPDTMRLSLHVMSRAVLGQKMEWPQTQSTEEPSRIRDLPSGHTMDFTDCLTFLLRNIMYMMILPHWLLRNSPVKGMRKTFWAYIEFGQYMREMFASKKSPSSPNRPIDSRPTTDLVSQLIRLSGDGAKPSELSLTDDEVIGNLFVFIIAGHETSASSIHFCLMFLALHPQVQRRVQEELDTIFEGRVPSSWSYDTDLPRLHSSLLQAVLNEQLRLIPPTITVPKMVAANHPQPIQLSGTEHLVPAGTVIRLCIPSVHRNPKYWPTGPPRDPTKPFHPPCDPNHDLEEFNPDRWIVDDPSQQSTGDGGDPQPASTRYHHHLFTPTFGSYIPFSLAARACLGQRFAQISILAALAGILCRHSVELAVDPQDAVRGDPTEAWKRARDRANWTWQNKCKVLITLQIRDGGVPVRIVARDAESF